MYISRGNIKVKASIFNLPCGVTCKQNLDCSKYCYAKKSEVRYKAVLPCRKNNLKESKQKDFVSKMLAMIKKRRIKYFRIHESGDFYSSSYVLKWYNIINQLPDIKFYAYTKRDDIFDAKLLAKKPHNLTLIYSLDGIQGDNKRYKVPNGYNKLAIIHKTDSNCPAIKSDIKCMKNCFKCISDKSEVIIFKKH